MTYDEWVKDPREPMAQDPVNLLILSTRISEVFEGRLWREITKRSIIDLINSGKKPIVLRLDTGASEWTNTLYEAEDGTVETPETTAQVAVMNMQAFGIDEEIWFGTHLPTARDLYSPRPMQFEDAEAAAALIRQCFMDYKNRIVPPPSALQETRTTIQTHLEVGGGAIIDGPLRDAPLACVLWKENEGGLYIGRLCVRWDCTGKGRARRLLQAAEIEARRLGLPRLHLGVRLALPGNRRLFARLGFTETRLRTHDGYPTPTWTEAERWLAPPQERPNVGTPQPAL